MVTEPLKIHCPVGDPAVRFVFPANYIVPSFEALMNIDRL
jgi:hypothetical protein